jgi:signal transduction histidine kinase
MPECCCDRAGVTQALSNLIDNGVRYSAAARPRIEIGASPSPGGAVTIYVRDNGIGIAPRHHERVFAMFRRLHGRDKFGGGMGVGLAMVKAIAMQHGGRAWVESEPGKGSTFFVTIADGRPAQNGAAG